MINSGFSSPSESKKHDQIYKNLLIKCSRPKTEIARTVVSLSFMLPVWVIPLKIHEKNLSLRPHILLAYYETEQARYKVMHCTERANRDYSLFQFKNWNHEVRLHVVPKQMRGCGSSHKVVLNFGAPLTKDEDVKGAQGYSEKPGNLVKIKSTEDTKSSSWSKGNLLFPK